MIHTEVVLQRNGCKSLRCRFHLHVLFSFDSLMQSFAPATAFHNTAGLLVDDLNLTIHHDILLVIIKHGVGLEQLQDRMDTIALYSIFRQKTVLLFYTFLV